MTLFIDVLHIAFTPHQFDEHVSLFALGQENYSPHPVFCPTNVVDDDITFMGVVIQPGIDFVMNTLTILVLDQYFDPGLELGIIEGESVLL